MELAQLQNLHLRFFGVFLRGNILIRDKAWNIFNLRAECYDFIKYTLNKRDKVILINDIICSKLCNGKYYEKNTVLIGLVSLF